MRHTIRQYSDRHYQASTSAVGTSPIREVGMREDWKRWSAAERVLAVVVTVALIGLPVAVWF